MRSAALCKQHTFALPWLALTLCSAVRPPPPPALDLDGACAGVKSSESWKDSKGSSHWSYRIKVQPWTVFGRVHVELHGYNVKVVDIYSGDVDEKAKSFWVSLHPEHSAGPDSTFQIEGEGESFAEPTFTCEGLHEPMATSAEACPLAPRFVLQSDMEELQTGRFRAYINVQTWVLQTIVTLDFGESAITVDDDVYGARVTEGGDGSSTKLVLSMLALKKCLGMYKDASCDNAFGFSGMADPPLVHLPRMSCLLTRSMPKPPPPASPRPPPSPPPGFDIDPGKCPGGGQTYFIVAPHQLASQAALQTWELNIHLNTWYNGMHVIIDFPSLQHADHALHVNAVKPPDVAKLISVTKHSAIIELKETAARDFQFEALGDVESLEVMCDLSGVRPFPPPPPPSADNDDGEDRSSEDEYGEQSKDPDPDDLTYVPDEESYQSSLDGQEPTPPSPPPLPLPEPMPPTPPPPPSGQGVSPLRIILIGVFLVGAAALAAQQNPTEAAKVAQRLRLLRTKCSRTPLGRKLLALVSQHPIGRKILLCEARYLGMANFGPSTDLELVDVLVDDDGPPKALLDKHPRPKPRSKPRGKGQKAAGREDAEEREAEPLQSNGEAAATEEEIDPMDEDWPQVTASSEGTRFVVRLGASASESVLHLDDAQDLKELMTLVSQACDHLGVDMTRGFRMLLVDEDGTTTTVGKSCTMERIRSAKQIELVPKPPKDGKDPGLKPAQRCRPASGGTVPGPALGGARGRGRPE